MQAVFPCHDTAKIIIIGEKMRCQTADIIIIGGGITGCCLAYELRKKSFSTILLEKDTIGAASSGRSGGGIRQQNRVPQELPLAMLSKKVWQRMARELDTDFEYRQNGNLKLLLSESEIRLYREKVERQRSAGLEVSFLNQKQVRELLPVLSRDIEIFGGTYCPSDGTANPLLVTKAVAAEAGRLGADLHEHDTVTHVKKNRINGKTAINVKTGKNSYESPVVINAAGAWSGDIFNQLGMHLPFEIKRSHILVTQAILPVIKPFVSHPSGYMRQALNGNLHLGVSSQPVSGFDTSTDVDIFETIAGYYIKLFPFMEHLPIIRTWAGLTCWTPDAFPVIGPAPGMEGFYLAAGFSGHGFCLGPGAARVLSQVINGEQPDVDLECFSWKRFLTRGQIK